MSKTSTSSPAREGTRGTAAERALREARERRRQARSKPGAREIGGRDGPEPTRFGDWEKDGIASDF